MATQTSRAKLSKPAYTEDADIGVINSNMDKLDDLVPFRLSLAIGVSSWGGSGPYTYEISDSRILESTIAYVDLVSRNPLQDTLTWGTATGKITLSTGRKPTATLSGSILCVPSVT